MRLIAQLLDYAERTLKSMKTAQPGIVRGKNNRMCMEFICAASACVGCIHSSMHAEKHYLNLSFNEMGSDQNQL